MCDLKLEFTGGFDIIMNPGLKERFIGNDMTFPFTYKDLKAYGTFDDYGGKILELIKPGTLIIGHAFENDIKMILDSCHKFGMRLPEFDYVDTNILYNAVKGKTGEHSLTNLAAEFGVEFKAHDPMEDARAALIVAKNCVGDSDLAEFFERHGIFPGGFRNGTIRKCYNSAMGENQKRRIFSFNRVFDVANAHMYNEEAESYYIDTAIASECDCSQLAKKLIERGGRLTASTFSADVVITNNLSLRGEEKYVPLKTMLLELGIPFTGFDFAPSKIRDENGRPISLTDYYDRAYENFKKDGILSGKKIAFSKSAEQRTDFEQLIVKIVSNGGLIFPQVNECDYFIVDKLSDLRFQKNDGRIRAYLMSKKPEVTEFSDFISKLNM